ncbi:MAG: carbohydrate kinase family protein [Lachnospiraceae bacterium]|nr:carbohydrate kinase family protein [Lachnospiraceae bacterium]
MRAECLFIGNTTMDMLIGVRDRPASDTKVFAERVIKSCGGVAFVAASAFQKLGGRAGLITSVGWDCEETKFIRETIDKKGFDPCQIIEIAEKASSFSVILVEKTGERCIVYTEGCMGSFSSGLLDKGLLRETKCIHIGGIPDQRLPEIIRFCRENTEALISVDSSYSSKEVVDEILPLIDIFIPDEKAVRERLSMEPEEACRYFVDCGASIGAVTLGERGSIACCDKGFFKAPAYEMGERIVDTTGAGDNFHGAFLYCLLRGWGMEKTLRFSNAFAALSCRDFGGISGEPSLEDTSVFVEGKLNEI